MNNLTEWLQNDVIETDQKRRLLLTSPQKCYIYWNENRPKKLQVHSMPLPWRYFVSVENNENPWTHCNDIIMSAMASQFTGVSIVSNHLSERSSKKISMLRITCLCDGNPPVTGEFPFTKGHWRENCYHLMTSSSKTSFLCLIIHVYCHSFKINIRDFAQN